MTEIEIKQGPKQVRPYSILAAGYDVVMNHVNYGEWAVYIHRLLAGHSSNIHLILELGCGTGSFALEMQPRGPYNYLGSDFSPQMIQVACRKANLAGVPVLYDTADFTNFRLDTPVDAVILLYDGINYLLEVPQIASLMRCTFRALKPGGLFIFDQSTPVNSLNNEAFFEDADKEDDFEYERYSRYDEHTRLHTTTFDITVREMRFQEEHIQRAYTLETIRSTFLEKGFEERAVYDGFTLHPATKDSERVHWVLNRPE